MRKNRKQRAQQEQAGSRLSQFWKSRASLLLLVVIFGFVTLSVLRETFQRVERQQEVVKLEDEIARLESRNARIRDAITVLNSTSKRDKLSRTKLGVQQPGEQVVFFPGEQVPVEQVFETGAAEAVEAAVPEESNPSKWKNYFLGQYEEAK